MAGTSVSVVITVLNEEKTIDGLLQSLQNQTYSPSEVIVVDGGSSDGTLTKLKNFSAKWKQLKTLSVSGNRSVGRNLAAKQSRGKIIAFTDAGCVPEKNWLSELIKPFSDSNVQVVSGYYRGLSQNIFQKCLIPYVLVMPDKAEQEEFFPATRSMAIRKWAWNKSGGFDIGLSHNEDYAYAHKLKKLGFSFTFAPKAIVNWLPRKNLKQAAWMFFRSVLARIILKQHVGIFCIAVIVLGLLETLTETGINIVLIQEKDSLDAYKDTAWVISIIRGVLISLLIFLLAPWVSSFFHEPSAITALQIFALVPLVRGFINPSSVFFQKELFFSREFFYRSAIAIFEAAAMVSFGLIFRTASSLAIAILCSALFEAILSHIVFKPGPKFSFITTRAENILRRGKWLNGFGIFAYIFSNADNIMVGRLLGSAPLGVYQYSYNVSAASRWAL